MTEYSGSKSVWKIPIPIASMNEKNANVSKFNHVMNFMRAVKLLIYETRPVQLHKTMKQLCDTMIAI